MPKGVYKGNKGHKMSIKARSAMITSRMRRKHQLGYLNSLSTRKKIREWQISHPNRKFKDTCIELKIEEELKKRGINYQKQVPLCKIAIVDFYLPEYRIVIQCDGDYWHRKKGAKERDEKQDKVLNFNGFNVYRFWEYDINQSPKKCINKIILTIL